MHLRLFEHPDSQAMAGISRPALGVTGTLPNAKPSLAYEGRLTIVNAGGDCTVELLSGTLPPGATVSVDNANKQVVVAWPAYSEGGSAPFNGSFEQGAAGWELGPGWSVRNDHAGAQPGFDGTWDARYDGAGSALIMNAERRAVTGGQSVTASVQVEQGASSRGAAGAAVRLEWLSVGGAPVGTPAEGNMVDDASGGAVLASTVTAIAPADGFARLGARGFRRRQNSPLWIDDFAWSLVSPSVGTNAEGTIGPITLRVTDSLGRTAIWSGTFTVVEWALLSASFSASTGTMALEPVNDRIMLWDASLYSPGATFTTRDYDPPLTEANAYSYVVASGNPNDNRFGPVWTDITGRAISADPNFGGVEWIQNGAYQGQIPTAALNMFAAHKGRAFHVVGDRVYVLRDRSGDATKTIRYTTWGATSITGPTIDVSVYALPYLNATVDEVGNLYLWDSTNNRVRKYDPDLNFLWMQTLPPLGIGSSPLTIGARSGRMFFAARVGGGGNFSIATIKDDLTGLRSLIDNSGQILNGDNGSSRMTVTNRRIYVRDEQNRIWVVT